ncbi:MAG: dihydrolipoamide acetyltransferase family protein [Woeseiaceae bacterium]
MSEYVFKLPDLGEGTVESEIGEWNIAIGEDVAEEAVVGTMMTDKAAVELVSPVSGKVVSLAGEPGDIIAVGAPLVVFETSADAANRDAEKVVQKKPPEETVQEPQPKMKNGKIVTSPAVRRRARDAGVDLADVPGSGTGGRILRDDLDRFLKSRVTSKSIAPAAPTQTSEVKVIGLRRIIAERMTEANREVPHFSYVEEVDLTELESLRQHLNSKSTDSAQRLTPLPFLGCALIRALKEFPQCNTTYDKDRNVLLRHEAVHLGVATQTADGLKVPVIRNAQRLTLEGLSTEIRRVSNAARENSISKHELGGSTITLTSLGKLGGIASTPVINLPEVAIIGVNRAVERPMVVDGQIAVRLMMNLSSSFDHRFVDGYDAAAMIQRIKEMLEHPATIFID